MEHLMGLLKIHVKRGVNLAIRDVSSSDPYVVIKMGHQKLKTRVVKKNINPEWNEDLTLSIVDPNLPIKLPPVEIFPTFDFANQSNSLQQVYDRDIFSLDDKMGDAEFDISLLLQALRMELQSLPSGTIITKAVPSRENCLAEESRVLWLDGKIVQNMFLRLRNVECGEVEIQLEWVDIPGSRGLKYSWSISYSRNASNQKDQTCSLCNDQLERKVGLIRSCFCSKPEKYLFRDVSCSNPPSGLLEILCHGLKSSSGFSCTF
ncbi:hypothetical protein ACFE04_005338 [Oxalis oulophora]